MVMAVGLVMGLHAAYEIFIGGTEMSLNIMLTYLPVSALYILSMAIGYLGLRYIELSISSPICNSSGAIVAVLTLITKGIGDDLWPEGVHVEHHLGADGPAQIEGNLLNGLDVGHDVAQVIARVVVYHHTHRALTFVRVNNQHQRPLEEEVVDSGLGHQ